ncbi:acyl-CoA-binding domain-containing protein 5 [Stomoxys calcitrans]|uniref:ACB domain-containing protein n=1 Tax=Stomoxys calcitrans TaxID=35570 RepID=A0A1I8PKX8_STOCA|nr:acyl-CoA-binding domain-containing protein 5 [Stomoxys calcitrans]XP_013106602.1 acyl-CoA-binding domain-containing protein 5 [Stomoxys calcitrans]XP_013106660.1 acyl-CoA-binding domain-containing protein 5 [Stomoxys calcitrans]
MASVQERFQAAVNVIKNLPKNGPYQPSPVMMLKFYGLFKQATEGPCNGKRPAFWDVVGKAKYDAWNGFRHLTKEKAMQQYVEGLQEIIETMSFTENVQNFVGSLQGLENINLDELEMIAPGMKQLAESHPSSPFSSRTNSPQHGSSSNIIVDEEPLTNGHASSGEEMGVDAQTTIQPQTEQQTAEQSALPETTLNNLSQYNGNIDPSDDEEYVDPFDIQHELNESLQHNNQILKQVQATVSRMNLDISSVNQRIFDLEKSVRDLKMAITNSKISASIEQRKHPKWWPLEGISPVWFILLVLWPFIARRLGKMLTNPQRK